MHSASGRIKVAVVVNSYEAGFRVRVRGQVSRREKRAFS